MSSEAYHCCRAGKFPVLVYCAVDRKGDVLLNSMSLDAVFWIASCTKLITSIACMQMVKQGDLALDGALERSRGITLRMLLNHTSGFVYAFQDLKLCDWSRPVGLDDFCSHESDVLHRPLVNQPEPKIQFGLSLGGYFQKFTLQPLTMNLAYVHQRAKDGTLSVTDHLYRAQLRKPETVKEMFTDQMPGKPLLANPCPAGGLSLSLSHQKSAIGRVAGPGSWEGLANLF
ncbi:beta-lactamase/transpeptidase-like protein [Aspergillus alliaceus]|uniref:Beta-lactamase/transpeptidase-like protein n=1 Tax=Petromyces alliaceus TaxID=209559 RepID=A0A5N7BT27_PETAA|nr:beta-lactamase/transpeptidase-like protein [Aspergillus alliaceus]